MSIKRIGVVVVLSIAILTMAVAPASATGDHHGPPKPPPCKEKCGPPSPPPPPPCKYKCGDDPKDPKPPPPVPLPPDSPDNNCVNGSCNNLINNPPPNVINNPPANNNSYFISTPKKGKKKGHHKRHR